VRIRVFPWIAAGHAGAAGGWWIGASDATAEESSVHERTRKGDIQAA
jgi:hypothetical protein